METLTLPARLDSLALISEFVIAAAHQAGLDDHAAWQVQLAVDEAATNIIQYAYDLEQNGEIIIEHELSDTALTIRLCDSGRGFDPNDVPPPDMQSPLEQRQVGGLGLYLINQLMDDVQFSFQPGRSNVVTLVKLRRPASAPALVYAPMGRVDAAAAPGLLELLLGRAREHSWRVVLDMQQVSFISSSGLRTLLLLMKELRHQGGDLRLCNMQPRVAEVFSLTGFTRVFAIDTSLDESLLLIAKGQA